MRAIICVLLVSMIFLCYGCGSGGSSSGSSGSGRTTEGKIMLADSSGVVTKVFEDTNSNGVYDSGEPVSSGITAADGGYSYSIELNSSSAPLRAEVSTSARSRATATKYTLATPAGQTLISPYTTMILNIMTAEGKSLDAAVNAVNTATGRTDNFFSTETYSDDAIKKTAQYITNSIINAVAQSSDLSEEEVNSALAALADSIINALQDIIASINNGTYDEDDSFSADLSLLSAFTEGLYNIETVEGTSMRIYGLKAVNSFIKVGDIDFDTYENGQHIYNPSALPSMVLDENAGAFTVAENGNIILNDVQQKTLSNPTVTPLTSTVQISSLLQDSTVNFPNLNKSVTFSGNAKKISYDLLIEGDIHDAAFRATLDLDNSLNKVVDPSDRKCGASSTEELNTRLIQNPQSCYFQGETSRTTYTIGGKLRIVSTMPDYRQIRVTWIDGNNSYHVDFEILGTTRETFYNRAAVEQILQAYFQ